LEEWHGKLAEAQQLAFERETALSQLTNALHAVQARLEETQRPVPEQAIAANKLASRGKPQPSAASARRANKAAKPHKNHKPSAPTKRPRR